MSTDALRAGAVRHFTEKRAWSTDSAAMVVLALHPLDDDAVPSRRYERLVSRRSRAFSKSVPTSERQAEREARSLLIEYRDLAVKLGEEHYASRYDEVLAHQSALAQRVAKLVATDHARGETNRRTDAAARRVEVVSAGMRSSQIDEETLGLRVLLDGEYLQYFEVSLSGQAIVQTPALRDAQRAGRLWSRVAKAATDRLRDDLPRLLEAGLVPAPSSAGREQPWRLEVDESVIVDLLDDQAVMPLIDDWATVGQFDIETAPSRGVRGGA